jgi:hypothetical protein
MYNRIVRGSELVIRAPLESLGRVFATEEARP